MPSLSSDLDLTIYVSNINDYRPQFMIDEFTVNFTGEYYVLFVNIKIEYILIL